MRRILLLAAAGVCFVPHTAVAQDRGPSDFDPRPLEYAYGVGEAAYGSSGLIGIDREARSLLQAKPASAPQKWHFDFMLYGLFANLAGDMEVKGHEADVDIGVQAVLDNLQFTAAGRARLQYERWYTAVDILYVGLAGSTAQPPADLEYRQWISQVSAGFSATEHIDAFIGARYNQLSASVDFQGPLGQQDSGSQQWWDPIIGGIFKGRMSEHFGYQTYADIGGFGVGSEFTTRLEAMISWYFNEHASLDLAYQGYYVDYEDSAEGFGWETWTYGPLLGLSVHF